MKIYICENCGKEHDGSYGSGRFCSDHCRRSHNGKKRKHIYCPNADELKKRGFHRQSAKYGTWKCEYCNDHPIFETRQKMYEHMHQMHDDRFGHIWNKGLTKDNDKRIKKIGKTYSDKIKAGLVIPSFRGKHHSEKTKQLLSKNSGGVREGAGRGKHGRYHGIWCDSSWELAWVLYQEEHQIKFKRYHGCFEYKFEGKLHKYYPDFELEDGTIVEIKGYWSKQWQAKLNQLPKDKRLLILGKNEMASILKYVKTKYGNDFIQMYE